VRVRSTVPVASIVGVLYAFWPLVALADGGGSDTNAFARHLAHGAIVALGASYIFGLATSLTPCVYPRMAITVSLFAREAKSRFQGILLSLTFVLGIVSLFTPMGVASALTGKGLGVALGKPCGVAVIASVFLALAASLFGAFELALPRSLHKRLSSMGGSGCRDAFVHGLACSLVAAPCVGPFLFGLLGWIATTRNVALGSAATAFYGLGLGTLFLIVGTFAVNLPKAGPWMVGIKWAGGVCLAYKGLAFIRDAMPKETCLALTLSDRAYVAAGASMVAASVALAGIRIAAERRIKHLSKSAKIAWILPAIVGLFMAVTWYPLPRETTASDPAFLWESSEGVAVARAASEHKPMLVDFGASWCSACQELEETTFPDPRVREQESRFVALHVDATDDDDEEVADLRQKYHATEGLPVVLLFDSSGSEAVRFTEFVPPDRFAAAMRTVQ